MDTFGGCTISWGDFKVEVPRRTLAYELSGGPNWWVGADASLERARLEAQRGHGDHDAAHDPGHGP